VTRRPSLEERSYEAARLYQEPELGWEALLTALDRFFDPLLSIFIFLAILLPGSIHGINLKYPLYALLIPLAFLRCFQRGLATPRHLVAVLAILTSLSFWVFVALVYRFETPSIVRQSTDILLTVMVCWFVRLAWLEDAASCFRFLRLVVNASLVTALAKLGLIVYALLRGMPIVEMVMWVDSIFGVDLMTMNLGDLLGRFQLIADELIPLCVFIVLRYRDRLSFSSFRASLTILILVISVLFSFSRYFWVFTLISFIMGLLMGKKDRFQAGLMSLLFVTLLASLPIVVSVYQTRFSDAVTGGSDAQRTEQIIPLQHFFFDAPLLGHGLGSYTPVLLRDYSPAGRYSYEVQLLALSGQIGIVGMFLLASLMIYYYKRLWTPGTIPFRDRIAIMVLLLLWLAAGTGNPLLFQPVAGVNYACLAALCGVFRLGPTEQERESGHFVSV
jgi:hypothetical protein